jgi:hypothetical protein
MPTARRPGTLWDRWLLTVVLIVAGYGLLLVGYGAAPAALFDRLGFGMTGAGVTADPARDYVLLVYGILGATLIGWMALLLALVRGPLRRRERWAWRAAVGSAAVWFAVDTMFSLATGFAAHAVFNLAFAAGIGVPLCGLRRHLRPGL